MAQCFATANAESLVSECENDVECTSDARATSLVEDCDAADCIADSNAIAIVEDCDGEGTGILGIHECTATAVAEAELIGCTPEGRNIEQHDIFFGIGNSVKDIIPDVINFWPEAKGKLHVDAWREVTNVNGFGVEVVPHQTINNPAKLFFINLGGYKQNEFEEFHYKMIVAGADKGEAADVMTPRRAFLRDAS